MRIALIGHGAMGRLIERLAQDKGHTISAIIDETAAASSTTEIAGKIKGCDVAIDFTQAAAVERNVTACVAAGVPLVEGTTGWGEHRSTIEKIVTDGGGSF